MGFRKSSLVFFLGTLVWILFLGTLLDGAKGVKKARGKRQVSLDLVRELGLSDLALFTEASHVRHLSLSDRHTPFRNHPMALEHFPTGSIAGPPEHLRP